MTKDEKYLLKSKSKFLYQIAIKFENNVRNFENFKMFITKRNPDDRNYPIIKIVIQYDVLSIHIDFFHYCYWTPFFHGYCIYDKIDIVLEPPKYVPDENMTTKYIEQKMWEHITKKYPLAAEKYSIKSEDVGGMRFDPFAHIKKYECSYKHMNCAVNQFINAIQLWIKTTKLYMDNKNSIQKEIATVVNKYLSLE